MNYDEEYVKDLERTIARQQEQVDKYSMFIKRLDELKIKMSVQDCSQFINPKAFIKWLENSSAWKIYHKVEDSTGKIERFQHANGRGFSILVEYYDRSGEKAQLIDVINAFQHVWDTWLYDHKGSGVISLIIGIMEYEDE